MQWAVYLDGELNQVHSTREGAQEHARFFRWAQELHGRGGDVRIKWYQNGEDVPEQYPYAEDDFYWDAD